ncbi:hypothetical protein BN1708_008967 [Verticillium longisporum]|uniref:Uncharacterized protein n=1 Tax=Verticillium longisporum TaxID=100787 RepID=A0A0G4N9H8_VERLO|nr:hypothetical protein BN1708_008967 [Verticillium longisporum]
MPLAGSGASVFTVRWRIIHARSSCDAVANELGCIGAARHGGRLRRAPEHQERDICLWSCIGRYLTTGPYPIENYDRFEKD